MTDTTTRPEQHELPVLSQSPGARKAAAQIERAKLMAVAPGGLEPRSTAEGEVYVCLDREAFLVLADHFDAPARPEPSPRHAGRVQRRRDFGAGVRVLVQVGVDLLRGVDRDAETDEWCATLERDAHRRAS